MSMLIKFKKYLRTIGFNKTAIWRFLKIFVADIYFFDVLRQLGSEKGRKAELKILVINHFFDGEIEALQKQIVASNISIKYIFPEPTFSRAFVWFPLEVQNGLLPYNNEKIRNVRDNFNKFCEKTFLKLRGKYKFDCIVTPSDSFFWLREFIVVAEKYGVSTVVADKEGTITPYDYQTAPSRIRHFYPPVAKFFFVWSERQKIFWIRSGVPENLIKIIGSIRTDSFVNLPNLDKKKSVLYFDFDIDAYINIFDWDSLNWTGERSWTDLRDSFHKVIYSLAIKKPELQFIIKCHPQQIALDFPENLINLDNITIIKGAPKGIANLLNESILVLGFQTTALLEASLMNVPVVYGAWGEVYNAMKEYLLPWNESGFGFRWARSERELEEYALELIEGGLPKKEDRIRLAEYFYCSNGEVAYRFLNEIKKLICRD